MTRVTLLLLALSSLALGSGPAEEKLDGPDSIYTRWLADILPPMADVAVHVEYANSHGAPAQRAMAQQARRLDRHHP